MSSSTKMREWVVKVLKIVVPLLFGGVLFGWLYKDMKWSELISIFEGDVSYVWLLLVFVLCVAGHVIRAFRWQMLTESIKPNIRFVTLLDAILLNYGVNLILPRMGEVSRCVAIAKKENVPFSQVFGMLLSERMVDMLSTVLVMLLAMGLQIEYFSKNFGDLSHITTPIMAVLTSKWLYVGVGVVVVTVAMLYIRMRRHAAVVKMRLFVVDLLRGVAAITKLQRPAMFLLYSLLLWTVYLLQIYFCFFAFDFTTHLSLTAAVVAFAMGSVAYALPVQGGIGPWHLAVIMTLVFYGIDRDQASAFALIAHAIPTLVMALGGVYAAARFAKR